VLKYGIEICEGLEKAHKIGVIHRDLKPGNVMLTKMGAKLMDFGLAKATAVNASPASSSLTATLNRPEGSHPLTAQGTIVGTFPYMSPEQVEGKEADARSDIFALGTVLYEMASGKRAFGGRTAASTVAAILASEPPPISSIQPMSPPALDQVVRTCLAKDPDERFQSTHDLKLQLKWIAEGGSKAGVPTSVVGQRRRRQKLVFWLALAGWVVAVAGIFATGYYVRRLAEEQRPVRAEIEMPPGTDIEIGRGLSLALSPDGRRLAIVASGDKGSALWVRDLASGKGEALPGTEGAIYPFWSPDSRMLGFFSAGKLRTIAASGGPVQILCDAPDGRGGAWSPRGMIIFTPNIEELLYRVPEAGGTPVAITKPGQPGFTHRNPMFLPDGKHFLFINHARMSIGSGALYAGSLDGGEPRLVAERASNPGYAHGYLLFVRDGNLLAQHFDADALQVSGNPIPVAQQIETWVQKDLGNFSVSETGMLIYRLRHPGDSRFAWRNLAEIARRSLGTSSPELNARCSSHRMQRSWR
jgi:eukaryotic-like serine/threonine-protein kinase